MSDQNRPRATALGETLPSREDFVALAHRRVIPVTRVLLADSLTPVGLYATLAADRPGTFLFESAETGKSWSRWSFVGRQLRGCADGVRGGRRAGWAPRRQGVPPAVTRWPCWTRRWPSCRPSRWPGCRR